MKPILNCALFVVLLFAFSCKQTYDCTCNETINNVETESYSYTGEGNSPIEVCNGQDDHFTTGLDTVVVDCEPK
ncbi:MAG: hypothetical protein ACHQFW_01500 [Chitinophagales bacterium]